jgi:excisionase family DNA binding protein
MKSKATVDLEEFLAGRPMVRPYELARALGVSQMFLSDLASRGEIEVQRVGRAVLIPRSEVLRVFGGVEHDTAA